MIWSSKLDASELYSDSYCHSCKSVRQITFGEQSSGSKDAGCNINLHSAVLYFLVPDAIDTIRMGFINACNLLS